MAYNAANSRMSVYSVSTTSLNSPGSSSANASRFSLANTPVTPINTSTTALSTTTTNTKTRAAIYDRNLNKTRASQVSLSAYAFLFSEIVQYTQKRVSGIGDLERRCKAPSLQQTVLRR